MSFDLMVFNKKVAPKNEPAFIKWYENQAEWSEEHSYDDPANTSDDLKNWFMEIIETFPAMNGPFATEDEDDPKATDFCIGNNVIYAAFSWSEAEQAYETAYKLASKHKVGFFDASGDNSILFPDENGNLIQIDKLNSKEKPWWKFW